MSKNKGGFFLASIFGALAGAIGGLLLAPKSGKETRKDIVNLAAEISKKIKTETNETKERVKDIYGKATDEAIGKYNEIKNSVVGKLAALKSAGEKIDREKYSKVVDEVVMDFKNDISAGKSGIEKLIAYLKKDWEKVKKALS